MLMLLIPHTCSTFIKILILLITFGWRNGPLIAAGFSYRTSSLSSPWIWNINHNNCNVDVVGKGKRTAHHESRINHEYYQSAAVDSRIVASGDGKFPERASKQSVQSTSDDVQIFDALDGIYHHESRKDLNSILSLSSSDPSSANEKERLKLRCMCKSLNDAGFVLLDQRDVDLCAALNAGYLLRLSLRPVLSGLDDSIVNDFFGIKDHVDSENDINRFTNSTINRNVYEASSMLFGGKVLVFRRGYSQELTSGKLILPKIDYFQANIVQRVTLSVSNVISSSAKNVSDFTNAIIIALEKEFRAFLLNVSKKLPNYLSRLVLNEEEVFDFLEQSILHEINEKKIENKINLWRYGGSTAYAPEIGNSLNPFLYFPPDTNLTSVREVDKVSGSFKRPVCTYDEVSASIPSSVQLLDRVNIGNVLTSGIRKRELLKKLFQVSELVEPRYDEVVVIWREAQPKKRFSMSIPKIVRDAAEIFDVEDRLPPVSTTTEQPLPSFQIRIFEDVTMANINAVMPKTKLVFRPADALRIDFVSAISLVVILFQQKFDNPRLDLIALVSVSVWLLRTFFRYSNILARYDLLVKKFLTSKIAHRQKGAMQYIVGEASTQRALRATLLLSWMCQEGNQSTENKEITSRAISTTGVKNVKERVLCRAEKDFDFDVKSTMLDLKQLGLISTKEPICDDEGSCVYIVDDSIPKLREKWVNLFDGGNVSIAASSSNCVVRKKTESVFANSTTRD